MREGFCVDASVGLKWFLGDEDLAAEAAKLAESFLTGHCELIVPALFFYEVGNALSVAVRAGRVTPDWAIEALDTLVAMNLPVMEPFEQLDESFALSVRFGISLYEASYVSAADARGYALVTADHRLFEAVHGERPFVKLLGNVEL